MRKARAIAEGGGYYHVVNRISGRRMLLSPHWKGRLLRHARAAADFSGAEILTYAMMGNHFHLLVHVPGRREVDDAELVRRMEAIYAPRKLERILADWGRWGASPANAWKAAEAKARLRARMYSLPQFVKTFSERFTEEFNRETGNTGSPWGQRFRSVLVERDSRALLPMAAYIDTNPLRAGIASDPAKCRWTGFGAAVAGDARARAGIVRLMGVVAGGLPREWAEAAAAYKAILDGRAGQTSKNGDRPRKEALRGGAPDGDRPRNGEGEEAGAQTLAEMIRERVPQFSAGRAIGRAAFVAPFAGTRYRRHAPFPIPCAEMTGIGTAASVKSRSVPV